ncbi:MAG: DUF2442 domain-containing protein [Pirellulaceae bacterium]|nr:DUF2442 domain-containing protein [Pirellulaceae bacterium]
MIGLTSSVPCAQHVRVTEDELEVWLTDGRRIAIPLVWYPRLLEASSAQRDKWELLGNGEGIHWPDLDEDLSVEGLLRGSPSPETRRSASQR